MTAADLKDLFAEATPRPWYAGHLADDNHSCNCQSILAENGKMGGVGQVFVDNGKPVSEGGNDAPSLEEAKANLALIVHCVNNFEALAAENERLRESNAELLVALKGVVALSDRKHDAWNKAHIAIARAQQQEKDHV